MKPKRVASTLGILAAAVARVSYGQTSAMPVYDPINYPSGDINLQGQWQQQVPSAGAINVDATDNLSYSGLNPSRQGVATMIPAAAGGQKLWVPTISTNGESAYYSFLMRVSDITALTAASTGNFIAGFNNIRTANGITSGTSWIRLRKDASDTTKYQFGIEAGGNSPTTATFQSTGTNFSPGPGALMVVARHVFGGRTDLWINPGSSTFGLPEANLLTSVPSTLFNTAGVILPIQDFFLRRNTIGPTAQFDDVRVGTTWASVVPLVWGGANSTWGSAGNWYNGVIPDAAGIAPSFLDVAGVSRTVTLGANRTVGSLILNSPTPYTIKNSAGEGLILSGPDTNVSIISGRGNHNITVPITATNNLVVSVGFDALTISGGISGATSSLTVGDSGVLVLTGANSYGGPTVVGGGALRAVEGAGLQTNNLVLSGGVVEPTTATFTRALGTGPSQVQLPGTVGLINPAPATTGAGGFSAFGTPLAVDIGGNGTGTGPALNWGDATFNPTALILNGTAADNPVELKNAVVLNGGTRTVTVNANVATISKTITDGSGAANLTKNGAGVLFLPNSGNSWSGNTNVTNGVLRGVLNAGVPTTGTLVLAGGVYEPTTATFTLPLGSGAGQSRIQNGASGYSAFGTPLVVDIGGNGSGAGGPLGWGNVDFNPVTLVLNASTASASLEFKNAIDLGSTTSTRNVAVNSVTNAATISGIISGTTTSGLLKTGPGTLALRNSANTYTGGTTVNQGAVNITSDSQLGAADGTTATAIRLSGGTLQFGANLDISSSRPIVLGTGGGTIDTNGFSTIGGYGGAFPSGLRGPGSLTKIGAGEFYTAGDADYVGLILKGGTFAIFNDPQLGVIGATNLTFDGGALKIKSSFEANGGRGMVVNAGGGTVDTNGFNLTFAGTIAGAGPLTKTGGGNMTVTNVRVGNLTVNSGSLIVRPDGTGAGVSKAAALSVTGGARLDLGNNHLITTSAVGIATAGIYNGVSGLIQSGRNGGGWGGSGIVTSQTSATTSNFTSIGIATGSQVKGIAAGATSVWAGQTVTGTDTLVMYTYGGDANLDGKINVDDYGHIDSSIPLGIAGWFNGDFNYDGKINVDDYGIIDFNIGIQGAPFFTAAGSVANGPSLTAVPEPGTISTIVLGGLGLSARRRRRQRA